MNKNTISLWGVDLPVAHLGQRDANYLASLSAMPPPDVLWLWGQMDGVWLEEGLDNRNRKLPADKVARFYSHPIWVVNGVFSAIDEESAGHRDAISNYVRNLGSRSIADFGGGFGELALKIIRDSDVASVDIIEPYASPVGKSRVAHESRIRVLPTFDGKYDCVIAQDVLEHVENPVNLAKNLVDVTNIGGYLVFANCFYPYIACHLPRTFYLRHTFAWVMRAMGLEYIGTVDGASHALVFQKHGSVRAWELKLRNLVAKCAGPLLNWMRAQPEVQKGK